MSLTKEISKCLPRVSMYPDHSQAQLLEPPGTDQGSVLITDGSRYAHVVNILLHHPVLC